MFHHIVFWKFRPEAAADLEEAVRRLRDLASRIPFIQQLNAGLDVVKSHRSWDLGLHVVLERRADLPLYDAHPDHLPLKAWMGERAAQAAAVDFED